jgi:hypothetical protein
LSMATHVSVMVKLVYTANKEGKLARNASLCSVKSDSSESIVVIRAISFKIDCLSTGAYDKLGTYYKLIIYKIEDNSCICARAKLQSGT